MEDWIDELNELVEKQRNSNAEANDEKKQENDETEDST